MDQIRFWLKTRLSRRELLTLFLAGMLPLNLRAFAPSENPDDELVIQVFVDTLIPADDLTPSASELGVAQEIINSSQSDIAYGRLVQLGCRWLNHQSNGDFTNLQIDQRIQILQWMEHADSHALPTQLFNRLRHQTMALYYTQPVSWKGLEMQRPPQPLGYMDYHD